MSEERELFVDVDNDDGHRSDDDGGSNEFPFFSCLSFPPSPPTQPLTDFDRRHAVPACLEQHADGRGRDALAQAGDDAAGDEPVFR